MYLRRNRMLFGIPFVLAALSVAPLAAAQSNLVRLGAAEDQKVFQVQSVALGVDRVVTAVRTSELKLRLMVWEIDSLGNPKRVGVADAGKIFQVKLTALGTDRVVTAVRSETNTLKLIAWRINKDGSISRLGQAGAGATEDLDIASLGKDRVIAAVRQKDKKLKLIAWRVNNAGQIQRLGDAVGGEIGYLSVCASGSDQVVTATTTPGSKLDVTAWRVDGAGKITKKGAASTNSLGPVAASSLSWGRVVTASRDSKKNLEVKTWDVSPAGSVSPHSTIKAGEVSQTALTSLSATRAITAIRQGDKNFKLINWDGVDKLKRLGSAMAGPVFQVSVSVLGNDRIVTSVIQDGDKKLKVIVWNEYAVSLLRGQWGNAPTINFKPGAIRVKEQPKISGSYKLRKSAKKLVAKQLPGRYSFSRDEAKQKALSVRALKKSDHLEADKSAGQSPNYALKFEPEVEGVDPMIAAGHKYLIVTQDHRIRFFDKQGKLLPSKYGEENKLSATKFFIGFIAPKLADGSVNQNSINYHLGFPPNSAQNCDPTATSASAPCMVEFYDTRVHYDPVSKRFVILSAVRHSGIGFSNTEDRPTDPIVRRYVAFAISKTEDPRDGFYQYITTDSNYSDWPRMTVNNNMLVVAHNLHTSSKDGVKPVAYLYDFNALKKGEPYPASQKIFPNQTDNTNVVTVTNYGSNNGWTYLIHLHGSEVRLYALKTPSDYNKLVSLHKSTLNLSEKPSALRSGAVYRNGKIYFTAVKKVTDSVPNSRPPRYSVWVIRIPLAFGPGAVPSMQKNAANGFLETWFGLRAPEDAPTDQVSYEMPAMAVNKNGDMVFVYGRVGVQTQKTLYPECRYSVYYHDSRGLKRSRLLQAGKYLPTEVHDGDSKATVMTFYDANDYSWAVADPEDDKTIWMANEFANSSSNPYKMIVGKVVP